MPQLYRPKRCHDYIGLSAADLYTSAGKWQGIDVAIKKLFDPRVTPEQTKDFEREIRILGCQHYLRAKTRSDPHTSPGPPAPRAITHAWANAQTRQRSRPARPKANTTYARHL